MKIINLTIEGIKAFPSILTNKDGKVLLFQSVEEIKKVYPLSLEEEAELTNLAYIYKEEIVGFCVQNKLVREFVLLCTPDIHYLFNIEDNFNKFEVSALEVIVKSPSIKKAPIGKENLLMMKDMGEFYKYPPCCILNFLSDMSMGISPAFKRKSYNGFVPCERCKSLIFV